MGEKVYNRQKYKNKIILDVLTIGSIFYITQNNPLCIYYGYYYIYKMETNICSSSKYQQGFQSTTQFLMQVYLV